MSGQGWTRTSSLLFVRQALYAIELLAQVGLLRLRDKDSNLDLRVQSAVSWPLDDPGKKHSVVHATRPRFDPGSLRYLPLPRVIVEAFWSPALASHWKFAGKNSRHIYSVNYRVPRGEDLSLSGGASMSYCVLFKLGITSFLSRCPPSNDEGGPLGPPSLRAAMPLQD